MDAKIHYPDGHHWWALDFFDLTEEVADKIHALIRSTKNEFSPLESRGFTLLRAAQPWIQGDQAGWIRVEFWSDNESILLDSMMYLAGEVGVEIK